MTLCCFLEHKCRNHSNKDEYCVLPQLFRAFYFLKIAVASPCSIRVNVLIEQDIFIFSYNIISVTGEKAL